MYVYVYRPQGGNSSFNTKNNLETYTQYLILVKWVLVKLFSCLVITSQGVGVTSWIFDKMFLPCLLYLPIPIVIPFTSNIPWLFSPGLFDMYFFTTIQFSA